MKNILHISDIHVSEMPAIGMSSRALDKLLPQLIDDLNALPKPDTIFISGDIAHSGKEIEYSLFISHFLEPLVINLGIDYSRVFVVPGNHDFDQKKWKISNQLTRSSLVANPDQSLVAEVMRDQIADDNCQRSAAFSNMRYILDANKNKPKLANKYFCTYEIDGVGVGCINTAWLAHKNDKDSLFISEWQVHEVIDSLKPFDQKIILMHHPLDWLNATDQKIIMNYMHSSKISCLFYGHMHEFLMTKESLFSEDSILKLQAGRLDTSKNDDKCGYSLISLHEPNVFESGEIYFRKLDTNKSKFRPWTERVSNGKAVYSLIDSIPFDPDSFSSRCNEIISEIEFDLLCNTGLPHGQQRKLTELFVLPSLSVEREQRIAEDSFDTNQKSKPTALYQTLNSLADSIDSLIILGGENSGKSAIAKRLALHYLSKQSSQNLGNVVFYLDAKGKSFKNAKRINSELLTFYTRDGNEPTFQTKIEKKLNSSGAVIIIDSIECLESQSLKILSDYISSSLARFIVLGQLSIRPLLQEITYNLSKHRKFKYLTIKALKRSHLKELVGKWKPASDSNQANNKVAAQALKVVSSAGMATNPFVITMLLAIRERKTTSFRSYMHEADLVENFIEVIMQKHVIPSGNVPQYKDVLLFLGYIASYMYKNSNYSITHTELTQKALDFNGLITQKFRPEMYINPIMQSGIMRCESGDNYKFSQICFFNFVLANWISKQSKTYLELDKELNFIKFDKVIEYVSAIKSDLQLLEYLGSVLDSAWENLIATEGLLDLKNAESEVIKCVGHDILDMVEQESLDKAIANTKRTEQEHDEQQDRDNPLNDKPITEVKVLPSDVNPIIAFHEILSLYARSFRAAEHILDHEVTAKHFTNIFKHYMNSMANSRMKCNFE